MRYYFLSLIFALSISTGIAQQSESSDSISQGVYQKIAILDVGLATAIPTTDFSRYVDEVMLGGNFAAFFRVNNAPIFVGARIHSFSFDKDVGIFFFDYPDYTGEFETETKTKLSLLQIGMRIEPNWSSKLLPYAEGLFGTKILNTRTELVDPFDNDESFDNYSNRRTWTLSYTGTIGLSYRIAWGPTHDIHANIGFSYSPGTQGEYYVLNESLPPFLEPISTYELKNSTTDLWLLHIGLTFTFGQEAFLDQK